MTEFYSDKLKSSARLLAESQAELDQQVLALPVGTDNEAAIKSFKRQHHARRSKIIQDYGTPTRGEIPGEVPFQISKLPVEIQVLIWELTLLPRLIPIKFRTNPRRFVSPCAPPPALHVCHFSRQLALRSGYSLAFETRYLPASIYINFVHDTIYIDNYLVLLNMRDANLSLIRSLAISMETYAAWDVQVGPRNLSHLNFLYSFPLLSNLVLAVELDDATLRYGNLHPNEIHKGLIPYLGQQCLAWHTAIRALQREPEDERLRRLQRLSNNFGLNFHIHSQTTAPALPSLEAVTPCLLTSATFLPLVPPSLRAQSHTELTQFLAKTRPEYVLDPTQVIAATRAKLAIFDDLARRCDGPFVEHAYRERDEAFFKEWTAGLRHRIEFDGGLFRRQRSEGVDRLGWRWGETTFMGRWRRVRGDWVGQRWSGGGRG